MELFSILDKYFFPPPITEGTEDETCMICGTPFSKKKRVVKKITTPKEKKMNLKKILSKAISRRLRGEQ